MKILKLLFSLSVLGFVWFLGVLLLPLNISMVIVGLGIVLFPFILGGLMKVFGLRGYNRNFLNCDSDDSDYGDAHYDSAYSMMSGNIYNSDD